MSAVLKKEVVPKKPVRKATLRTAVVVPKKTTSQKPAPKKKPVKAPPAEPKLTKRVTKKVASAVPKSAETVFVPSTASLRLLEKAELYRVWYRNNFPVVAARAAQVGGYSFVLLGTFLATATYLMGHNSSEYKAAVVCTQEVCTEIADSDLPETAPVVTFKNSLPDLLQNDTDFVVHVQNTTDFKVYLKNLSTGALLDISYVETQPDEMYRYLISPQGLSLANYAVVAKVVTSDATYHFTGPQFSVQPKSAPVAEETEVSSELLVATTTLTAELVAPAEVLADEDLEFDEDIRDEENSEQEVASAVTQTIIETAEVLEEVLVDSAPMTPITATIKSSAAAKYLEVNTGTLLPLEVKVFSQVESSEQPLYLGLATLVQGEWVFSLTALGLPSVSHLIYSSFDIDGVNYRSEGVLYTPTYNNLSAELVEGDASILVQKIDLALIGNAVQYFNRNEYFSDLSSSSPSLFERSYEEQIADGRLIDLLDEYMLTDEAAINNALKNHARITQVGKRYLLALSTSSINDQARALARLVAKDEADTTIIPTLNTLLTLRYETLRELVTENESRLNQDTSSLTSRDTDQDGVSDYDEIVTYATNPSYPDTDNDGVTDAVEIITGSDPLVSDVSMIVSAGATAEDLVFDEIVSIEQVEPLVVRNLGTGTDNVQALVTGKGLPNSYVYIVSPTLGTVGVIKVNETGIFSYTLEQTIADGKHEVYAVMTDVFGTIVASSKPRVFNKTQNRFVAAAVGSQNISFESGDAKTVLQLSTITMALGVVALGLILLLLTHALRSRPKVMLGHAK